MKLNELTPDDVPALAVEMERVTPRSLLRQILERLTLYARWSTITGGAGA